MLDPRFVLLGVALQLYGIAAYAWSTFKGHTQPNRVTWLLWTVAPLVAFAAEVSQGVGLASLMTFIWGAAPALVLLASFMNPKAYWKVGRLDIACGALSALAIVLWVITRTGNVAIVLSIAADALAAVPTVIKAYREPHTEHPGPFIYGIISAVITLLTLRHWGFADYAFLAYVIVMDIVVLSGLYRPRARQSSPNRP